MTIANPLYDTIFKKLMENDRVAKFFIGTLLDQNIHALQVITQEFPNPGDVDKISSGTIGSKEQQSQEVSSKNFFQLDFIVTILTDTGEPEKVHVEIQKIKNFIEPRMLSNFQAVHYNRRGTFDYEKRKLPSITIYILGFNLPEIQSACIKLENTYEDLISNKMINHKIDFIPKIYSYGEIENYTYIILSKETGTAIAYNSTTQHEIKEILSGERWSIVMPISDKVVLEKKSIIKDFSKKTT